MQPKALKTLADYNPHGVQQGVYPYPEECVFVINGVQIERSLIGGESLGKRDATIVVARRSEVAHEAYLSNAPEEEELCIQSCMSLADIRLALPTETTVEIGRASCRERVCQYV